MPHASVPSFFINNSPQALDTHERPRKPRQQFSMAKRLRDLDDGPSDADIERFSDVTQTCPSCGTTLYDDVEVCWNCGHALGAERKIEIPLWMWITAAGLLSLAIIGMLVRW